MNTTMLKRARKLWCLDYIPHHQQRANIRAWVRAIRVVGNNWLLLKNIEREEIINDDNCKA
jgi:hypothetical protein